MNTDMMISMALAILLQLIQTVIPKNSTSKKVWKKSLLKVFKAIADAYREDSDFKI